MCPLSVDVFRGKICWTFAGLHSKVNTPRLFVCCAAVHSVGLLHGLCCCLQQVFPGLPCTSFCPAEGLLHTLETRCIFRLISLEGHASSWARPLHATDGRSQHQPQCSRPFCRASRGMELVRPMHDKGTQR